MNNQSSAAAIAVLLESSAGQREPSGGRKDSSYTWILITLVEYVTAKEQLRPAGCPPSKAEPGIAQLLTEAEYKRTDLHATPYL